MYQTPFSCKIARLGNRHETALVTNIFTTYQKFKIQEFLGLEHHVSLWFNKGVCVLQLFWRRQTQPEDRVRSCRRSDDQRIFICHRSLVTPRNFEKILNRPFSRRRINFFPQPTVTLVAPFLKKRRGPLHFLR